MSDRISLDIETIATVENPDFDEAAHWTVFAVALGHQATTADRSVDVLFRENHTLTAEARLIEEMISWIADRCDGNERQILTYNGEKYDLPILRQRAKRIDTVESGSNVRERLGLLLDTSDHVDLFEDMRHRHGHWISLDDALEEFGIDTDEPSWNGEKVTGADMPEMGIQLLTGAQNEGLRETIYRYAASDVSTLFELHDSLNETPNH